MSTDLAIKSEEPSKNEAAIKKQIEFYFSESNFRKDTFLKAASETDPDGFVPIAVLLTFNKLKALTTDVATILRALSGSESVTVSADGLNIRRSAELPESDLSKPCTLYVKGFPSDDSSVTIESIADQFSIYGKVMMVRMRKNEDSSFKGSCFIEYDSIEAVTAAVAASYEAGEIKATYKETPLVCIMPLVDWLQNRANRRLKNNGDKKSKSVAGGDADGDQTSKKRKFEDTEEKKVEYTAGLIILLKDIPVDTSMFQLKDLLKKIGDIKYVEMVEGATEAYVRVADLATAEAIIQSIEKGLPTVEGGANLSGVVITGDDELAYWQKIDADRKSVV